MPNYRLYCLGADRGFSGVHLISGKNDAEALCEARKLKLTVKCELWDQDRIVAVLDPHRS